jgi:hypothetical protein
MEPLIKIQIEGIGPVVFRKSTKATRFRAIIRASDGVVVSVPFDKTFDDAKKFVSSKIALIKTHLARISKREERAEIGRRELAKIAPSRLNISRAEAETAIRNRVEFLAKKHSIEYSKISIRAQKKRWGSCSTNNAISLNIKIAKLPDDLMDYIILHELAHTIEHNHSPRFWRLLAKYSPDPKSFAKRLKNIRIEDIP